MVPALTGRQRGILAGTISANALVFYDQTSVTLALPDIGREFGARTSALQWTITAYLLALAVFMLVAGRLADRYGHKRMFLSGLVLFGAGSALCALAPTLPMLLAARFVQGIGGAVVQPLALSTTTRAIGGAQRGWAIGVLAAGGTSLLTLGPLLTGALLALGWRVVFLVNLPVVAFAVFVTWRWVTPSAEAAPRPINWGDLGVLLVGLGALVFGVTGAVDLGAIAAVPVFVGVLAIGLFLLLERRSTHPFIDLGMLRDPRLATSLAALFAIQFAVLGLTVPLALYLRRGLGASTLAAGFVIAVAGLGTPLLSMRTGRSADRRGERALVVPGLGLAVAGLAAVALLAPLGGPLALLPGLLIFTVARPMIFTPAGTGPFAALGGERRAFAASLATESRQLGAVLGVALGTATLSAAHGSHLTEGDPTLVDGFRAAVAVSLVACALAAVVVWRWMPRARTSAQPAPAPWDPNAHRD